MEPRTATFFDLVRPQMPAVEARMRAKPGVHHPALEAAVEHLLSGGGKRVRPTLVLLVGGMVNADLDRTVTLAAAVEMLHTATLVHDDLIDQSTIRRGIPTINARMTPGATVLTGDYIFARAADLAARTDSLAVMEGFAKTLMTIVNGEIQQLFGEYGADSREDYYDRIYAKTASLFELAARGPGLLTQADPPAVEALGRFGYCVGVAFQLVDDILDFVGDQAEVGKPVANDLRQGIVTLPTLLYLKGASPEDADSLLQLLQNGDPDSEEFDRMVKRIRSSGAVAMAKEEAREVMADGLQYLEEMPPGEERDALRDLADYLVHRTT
jgi:octaprenyl-diphosphate synthase